MQEVFAVEMNYVLADVGLWCGRRWASCYLCARRWWKGSPTFATSHYSLDLGLHVIVPEACSAHVVGYRGFCTMTEL